MAGGLALNLSMITQPRRGRTRRTGSFTPSVSMITPQVPDCVGARRYRQSRDELEESHTHCQGIASTCDGSFRSQDRSHGPHVCPVLIAETSHNGCPTSPADQYEATCTEFGYGPMSSAGGNAVAGAEFLDGGELVAAAECPQVIAARRSAAMRW